MYLKCLEVVGFKSFADPVRVDFHRGVTCVVGPNGCGKSNVLDAIRWVLGEQSAKALRGGSMQDVIFSGTDTRKPIGMAEVALTFAECEDALGTEYHEVRVARRIYRDGHGEYEINKTPCRLRDIHRLFMDTGIGRSAYSIMEQGKIDKILSSKPEERRAVFEEAAGITKFKTQKKEALRKLEATESNLIRVSDIIKEVNRQIGSLHRQANKAKRYQELFDRLKLLDTHLAARDYTALEEQRVSSQARHQALQMEFNELQGALESQEEQLQLMQKQLETGRQKRQELERETTRLETEKEKAEQTIEFNQRRIHELTDLTHSAQKDVMEAEEKMAVHAEQEGGNLVEKDTVQAEYDSLHADLEQRKSELETWSSGDEELVEAIRSAKEAVSAIEQDVRNKEEEVQIRSAERKKAEENFQSAQSDCATEEESYAEIQTTTQKIEIRIEALQHVLEGSGDQSLDHLKPENGGEFGLVGPMLEFLEVNPGYEKPIEVCLGKVTEALIFDSEDGLERAASQMTENSVAAFAIDSPETRLRRFFERIPPESALNVVTLKEGGVHFIRKVLKQYLIATDSDHARELRKKYPSYHIVSQQGEIWFHQGWELRGQQVQSGKSLVQQKNELTHLLTKRREIAEKKSTIESRLNQANALREQRSRELREQKDLFESAQQVISQLKMNEKSLQRDYEDAVKRQDQRQQDQQDLRAGVEEGQKSIEVVLSEISSLEESRKELNQRIETTIRHLKEKEDEVEQRRQAVSDSRVLEAGVLQRLKSIREQEETIRARLEELKQIAHQRSASIEDYTQKIAKCEEAMVSARQLIDSGSQRYQELKSEAVRVEAEYAQAQETASGLEGKIRDARKKASEVQGQFGKEEVATAQHQLKVEALTDRIRSSYQLDLAQWEPGQPLPRTREDLQLIEIEPAEGQIETQVSDLDHWIIEDRPHRRPQDEELLQGEETDWKAVADEIESLKDRIERMGPVNVEAITEHAELEERQSFLQHQEEDLVAARDRLHEAIKKINVTTRELFADTFSQIQGNFAEMFQELFGGGKAALNLEAEADPLEAGIEIIARPPGKQPQSISLLSGGERTMTAVALLFAIYMVKPSPFCFLDEMDAPLDESNINRFIRILQRFVKQSQFCVITHNKRTISAADVIYGVTMQEQGVSRLVSVRLNRQDEDPLFQSGRTEEGDDVTIADSVRGGTILTSGN